MSNSAYRPVAGGDEAETSNETSPLPSPRHTAITLGTPLPEGEEEEADRDGQEDLPLVPRAEHTTIAMPHSANGEDSDSEIDEDAFLDADDADMIDALTAPRKPMNQIAASAAAASSSAPSPAPPPTIPMPNASDGVFANMSAGFIRPEEEDKFSEEPPSYVEAAQDTVPPYFQTTIITGAEDPDEILVEGLPAGSSMSFIWNMLISMAFQFVGFLLTFLLHTSHAAKCGSRAGLGITLINYGLFMQQRNYGEDGDYIYIPDDQRGEEDVDPDMNGNAFVSYALVLLGWFMVVRNTTEYIRIRRMLAIYMISPESIVV